MSDGVVLQRDRSIPVRGWADAGEPVAVTLAGRIENTVADKDGLWSVLFPPMSAGGPYEMVVAGNNKLMVKDLMIGDVWLCSGQSNMELPMMRLADRYAEEIADSASSGVREFTVPDENDFKGPREDYTGGSWRAANPGSVLDFSGVAYFFAKELHEKTGVTIGIVNASLGGAPIESFMSAKALAAWPDKLAMTAFWSDPVNINDAEAKNAAAEKEWAEAIDGGDAGLAAKPAWSEASVDDSGWQTAPVPCNFRDIGFASSGVIWFRRTISLPEELAGQPARLDLGTIVQADIAYVNGVKVGSTPYQYPPRRYTVPAGLLHAGENTIAIRIIATAPNGEMIPDKPYELIFSDRRFDLKGAWKCKVGVKTSPKKPTVFVRWMPTGLYNAMIAPLAGMPIKGMVWYQGESNTGAALQYGGLLKGMIDDWRALFGKDTPFLIAQLPNLGLPNTGPTESGWATLRNEQRKALEMPLTGMAVTYDLGEWNDIHPENKLDVGSRLARAALRIAYSRKIDSTGPLPVRMTVEKGRAIIDFEDSCTLVAVGGGELRQFTIAGKDGVFHEAHAVLDGSRVIVWSRAVPEPVRVRHAWADNPAGANFYDCAGLPATSFEMSSDK
jgi:sialate O-acetylesterase